MFLIFLTFISRSLLAEVFLFTLHSWMYRRVVLALALLLFGSFQSDPHSAIPLIFKLQVVLLLQSHVILLNFTLSTLPRS